MLLLNWRFLPRLLSFCRWLAAFASITRQYRRPCRIPPRALVKQNYSHSLCRVKAVYIGTSDGVVDMEAVFAVRAEAPVHLRQLHPHELRSLGARSSPHVQVLEDREAA